jgi:uncharacterized protein (DUF4415 family)
MKGGGMSSSKFDEQQLEELAKLEAMSDDEIDTTDIPEAPAENWMHAKRGEFYRPLKQPVTIRLDADILAWFKEHAEKSGYQTEINRVLRQHVTEAEKKRV